NPSHSEAAQTIKLATATEGATIRYTLTYQDGTPVEADYNDADGIVLAAPPEGTTRDYTIKTYTKTTDATSMDDSSNVTYSYTITTPLPNYTVTVNFLDTGLSVGTVKDPITYTYPKGTPFTLTAPDVACEVFDHWKLTNNVKDRNRTLTYAEGITENIELNAVYAPVISKIEFKITPPVAGNPLAIDSTDLVSCEVTVQSKYNITNLLNLVWFTADETAAYNTAYTAAIIMKNMEDLSGIPGIPPDLKFYFADNVTLTANDGAVCELYQDSSGPAMYVEFPKTAKPMLLGITPPNSISLVNGADLTLPTTVGILTEDESITSAGVSWGATGYQQDQLTSQRLTIAGTITVPEGVDGTFISHNVTQSVFVAGAPYAKAPISSLASGEYDSGRTVMLVTETPGAEVYYTTDGTMPTTASTKYTKPITIDKDITISAISAKDGMQTSAASVFTYKLSIPSKDHDTGHGGGGNADFIGISIGSVKVNTTLSGKTATLSLTDTQVKQVLTGAGTDGIVRMNLSTLQADTLVLPVKLLDAVRTSATAHTVEILYQTGSVTLDKAVLASLTGGEVKVSLKAQAGRSLTDKEKQPLGKLAEEALVLEVSVSVGGTEKTGFNGGKLLVRAPYKLPLN
ncbi:MAG: chitobiase/beta-hexosaminidase C-terminal domain-containing protein, partial [Oscillospiraceae bacterium]